jgi:sulfur relay (sulfurtransferase) DsrF/TusC family protein
METISIILRKPPYGCVDASEAVRHAMGGATMDLSINLVLVDGGVVAARKGQDVSGTEYSSIETGILDCMDMGVAVYADRDSLDAHKIEASEIVEGAKIADSGEIARILKNSYVSMIF